MLSCSFICHGEEPVEVVVGDSLAPDFEHSNWQSLPAFYVAASDAAKKGMDRAVGAAIGTKQLLCLRQRTCAWLETSSRRYLQAMSGNGRLARDGFVCPGTPDLPGLRYFSHYYIDRGKCLPLFWEAKAREYSISDR